MRFLPLLSLLVVPACRATATEPLAPATEAESTIERLQPSGGGAGTLVYEVTVREGQRSEAWRVTMRSTPFTGSKGFRIEWRELTPELRRRLPQDVTRDLRAVQVTVQRPGHEDLLDGIAVPEFGIEGGLFGYARAREVLASGARDGVIAEETLVSLVTSTTLFVVWLQSEAFAPLLRGLVGRPPVRLALRSFLNGSAELSLGTPEVLGPGTFVLGENGPVPSLRLRQEVRIFDEPAMELELEAVEAWAPLDLTLGLVRIVGRSLLDPARSIEIRLAGAAANGHVRAGTMPVLRTIQLTLSGEAVDG